MAIKLDILPDLVALLIPGSSHEKMWLTLGNETTPLPVRNFQPRFVSQDLS
jgi:hypothetical protein